MHLPVANQSLGPAFGRLGSRMACGTFLQSHGLGIAGDIIAGVAGVYIGNWVLKLPFWISPHAPQLSMLGYARWALLRVRFIRSI